MGDTDWVEVSRIRADRTFDLTLNDQPPRHIHGTEWIELRTGLFVTVGKSTTPSSNAVRVVVNAPDDKVARPDHHEPPKVVD